MSRAFSWRTLFIGILVAGIVLMGRLALYYRDSYHQAIYMQREFKQLAEARKKSIIDMQTKQRVMADIDAKYTRGLTNARLENDRLRADVAAGRRQLRIKGTCGLSKTTASSGMGNGSAIKISRKIGSTVFDIRSEIIIDQQKLQFLQEYVRNVCLAPKD